MSSHPRFVQWASCLVSLFMGFGLVAGLGMLIRLPVALAAGPITVTTFNDELNNDNDCSLREAIQAANTNAAVDACPAGSGADTIVIPAGTYTLTIAGRDEDLNITGDLDITDTVTLDGADMATTIINANAIDRALNVPTTTVAMLTLLNLTVFNGAVTNDDGGGLRANGPVILFNTAFISNTAGFGVAISGFFDGGGAYIVGPATVTGTTFLNNKLGSRGHGGGAFFASWTTVTGTTFLNNTTSNDGIGGGALFTRSPLITNTTFSSNRGGRGGGAYIVGGYDLPAVMAGVIFVSNTATGGYGGGAYFELANRVIDSTFLSNTAPGGYGGGAYFSRVAVVIVIGTTFSGNTAHSGGGAVFENSPNVVHTTFSSNTAYYYGGGAYFYNSATVTSTAFSNNAGGGAFFYGNGVTTGDFVNTLFAANQGIALYLYNSGGNDIVTLRHVTVASPTVDTGLAVYVLSGTVNITNTIVASYSVGLKQVGGVLNENYNLFSGVAIPYSGTVVSGGNSMTGTTTFADTTLYKLTSDSVAIDAGIDVGIATDFEGEPRPAGAGFDIGWDELMIPISGLSASNDSPKQMVHTIYFTATISGGTGVSYQWNFGDNSAISNLQSPTHHYAVPGNYTAIVTATNSLGSANTSTPVTITEAAFKLYLPLITKSPSAAANVPTKSVARELGRWAWRSEL